MTNILVPTDFTGASLQLAIQAVQATAARPANIFLFHAFEMPSSEFDLLDAFRPKPYARAFTDLFRQECKQLKEKYPKEIQTIQFRFMEGSTAALFRNFIDANDIDIIYCPEHYQFKPVDKKSVDPIPLFNKSGVPVVKGTPAQSKPVGHRITSPVPNVFATAQR